MSAPLLLGYTPPVLRPGEHYDPSRAQFSRAVSAAFLQRKPMKFAFERGTCKVTIPRTRIYLVTVIKQKRDGTMNHIAATAMGTSKEDGRSNGLRWINRQYRGGKIISTVVVEVHDDQVRLAARELESEEA